MATVTEQISEVLLGTTEEPNLSQETRANFMQHAIQDEATGEYYLSQEEFINAIAPEREDYVSRFLLRHFDCRDLQSQHPRDLCKG